MQQALQTISQRGIAFIGRHEGFRPVIYKDPAGHATIGYGHKIKAGENVRAPLDPHEAFRLLRNDIEQAEDVIRRLVNVPLSQAQYDALVSFVFNVGGKAFAASSLLGFLNAGNYRKAAEELLRWNHMRIQGKLVKSPGLTARRASERVLFLEGVEE